MQTTEIIWTEATWNPTTGCNAVSEGCAHCYARALSKRFGRSFEFCEHPDRLDQPLKLRRPTKVFVNSMSDLLHNRISRGFLLRIIDVIRRTPQHTYQTLTKRPERLVELLGAVELPPNLWVGTTVESQSHVDRIDALRRIRPAVRFLSCEPLLTPLKLSLDGIDWVIVGGESGPHTWSPCDRALSHQVGREWVPKAERIDWVRDIRDQCVAAKVPFFFKQWGGARGAIAGNELDGLQWLQFPEGRT